MKINTKSVDIIIVNTVEINSNSVEAEFIRQFQKNLSTFSIMGKKSKRKYKLIN